jgi:hypothetical protein
MNRRSIRDHRRIPRRFRFTTKEGVGTTTWPLSIKNGEPSFNPSVRIAYVIDPSGRHIVPKGGPPLLMSNPKPSEAIEDYAKRLVGRQESP